MAYTYTKHLERIPWQDGDRAYCRKCDDVVPLCAAPDSMLVCEQGHEQHAANVVVNGSWRGQGA